MPRNCRIYGDSKIYHIMLRGNNKSIIFYDDIDRRKFINILKRTKDKYRFKIYAYCLMNNHVHILIFDEFNMLSSIIQSIAITFALYFNKKYDRVGHVFQNRYKSKNVENELYLKNLVRYIHQNPEKAGICLMNQYYWSSYLEYIDISEIIDTEFVLNLFNNLDSFIKYNSELIDSVENEIEYEFINEVSDEYAKEIIKKKFHLDNLSIISNYKKDIRDKYLAEIKKLKCISNNQISRILNISRKIIERS